MLSGSALFFFGAAIGVARVFTEPDPEVKARMLAEHELAWRVSQPFYAVGALAAAAGVLVLASEGDGTSATVLAASGALLLVGALAWSVSVLRRAQRPRDFAFGRLPAWPWSTYVWLTFAGLALLGAGILTGTGSDWLGWVVLGADALFVVLYVRFGDIPPFVFYVLLAVVGVAVL
jgi:hypothetical protein